ncbi:HEAT repeat domain-containing protein [Anatilimnocola sp. NA78]|uniref:HEAT repeat domain-containing protein n=1 Tax=Anatilimnocola sp. NA78 TaxID=3415683 RepID=UPI003CE55BEA
MGLKDWSARRTPLQLALERGMKPGGKLADEVDKLGEYAVTARGDGEAISQALSTLAEEPQAHAAWLRPLTGLLQDVSDAECEAFEPIIEMGLPALIAAVEAGLADENLFERDDVLFALKILAMYGSDEGTDTVIQAAQRQLDADDYMWSVILANYGREGHPQAERLFAALSDPLPTKFLSMSLLDAANSARLSGAEFPHPFDSAAGIAQLEGWLTDSDPEHASYAVSATAALPFLDHPRSDGLLALALDHASDNVQLEGAWVAAKLGRDAGIQQLARYCLDTNHSDVACHYLKELDREDAIPAECLEPVFRAKAEFARWLAHPCELGDPPDELTLVDHRELAWPPEREIIPVWLLRFRKYDTTGLDDDQVDVGMVGTVTFCLFTYQLNQRPPEDCYAIHCYWELTNQELISELEVEPGSKEYDHLLKQYPARDLSNIVLEAIAEPAASLNYPQTLVAIGTAERRGQPGWVVLDGPRSRFYAASEIPPGERTELVLKVHVGRELLGFREPVDRKKYLLSEPSQQTAAEFVAKYEDYLQKALKHPANAEKVLGGSGVLKGRFDRYVNSLQETTGRGQADLTIDAYRQLLAAVQSLPAEAAAEMYDSFAPLGEAAFRAIVALKDQHHNQQLLDLVHTFEPYWQHNMGYSSLGAAAYAAADSVLAEKLLLQLHADGRDSWGESTDMLAEIYRQQGRMEERDALIIKALLAVQETASECTGKSLAEQEEIFQKHREHLRIIPDGPLAAQASAIPETLLPADDWIDLFGETDAEEPPQP